MTRLSSYRDFDWVLLGFILLLSLISVLEIKSATLHTKFPGFDHKQIGFLALRIVLMFLISLIDYPRLIDTVHWAYGIGILSLIAVALFGTKVLGGKRWISFHGAHFQPSEWIKLILGGIRFKQVAIILPALVLIGRIAWKSGKPLKPYQQARINAFTTPDSDP